MNKVIFLIPFLGGCVCLGQSQGVSTQTTSDRSEPGQTTSTQALDARGASDSTKALLQLVLPKVLIKESTLPEVARYFERESKKADPNHIGVTIVTLAPKDFGFSNATSAHVISFVEKDISLGDALMSAAQLFNMKIEIHKDIYIMPRHVEFTEWEKRQLASPSPPR